MFTHNRVLYPELLVPDAPDGWIISAPTRHDVLVTRASIDERGPERFAQLMQEARALWSTAAYPTSRHCWYVPPEGMGAFGEDAEAIVLVDESCGGESEPDVHLRMGDRLHKLYGETTPVRAAPRRVI